MPPLTEELPVKACTCITDPVTAAGIANDPENTGLGYANFARGYATKRYRSNCINWGMTPFLVENPEAFQLGDYIFVPHVRSHVLANDERFDAYAVKPDGTVTKFSVSTGALTEAERQIIADGCLINYYRNQ